MNDFDYLGQLHGRKQERRWLQERLETLSAREGIVLAAALLCDPPKDMCRPSTSSSRWTSTRCA